MNVNINSDTKTAVKHCLVSGTRPETTAQIIRRKKSEMLTNFIFAENIKNKISKGSE